VTSPAGDRLKAVLEQGGQFADPGPPHVLQALRQPRIYMMDDESARAPWRFVAEGVEHKFHHFALPVVRRRRVGKNQ
jgi:hypothetical protein